MKRSPKNTIYAKLSTDYNDVYVRQRITHYQDQHKLPHMDNIATMKSQLPDVGDIATLKFLRKESDIPQFFNEQNFTFSF